MDTTLYVTLSHQTAMRRYMDLIANNIANMNTTAYRREKVMFQEYMTEMKDTEVPAAKEVAYVQDYGIRRDFTQGQLISTGNPLDVAISGKGLFQVTREQDPQTPYYTRNGHMRISDDGYLVTDSGNQVMSVDDAPIQVGINDTNIVIAADGTISSRRGVIGRLKVVQFEDEQSLKKIGDGLYNSKDAPVEATNFSIQRGMLESSNVNPIQEMTDMINVMRSYQSVAMLTDKYQKLREAGIQQLGRVQ